MKPLIRIDFLPPESAEDARFIGGLAALVNEVYAASEAGLWRDGAARTTPTEIADLIRLGQVAAAHTADALVGLVKVQQLDAARGELGMLVADPHARGIGVGSELVGFAERWAVSGGMTVMQLEILTPRDWAHPSKEFLRAWYLRLGYALTSTRRLEDSYPHLAPWLATTCDFDVYHKALGTALAGDKRTQGKRSAK